MTKLKRVIGRPATGTALTSTERSAKRDRELLDAGGRILRSLRLSPEAAQALAQLVSHHESERNAIEQALIGWQRFTVESHNK